LAENRDVPPVKTQELTVVGVSAMVEDNPWASLFLEDLEAALAESGRPVTVQFRETSGSPATELQHLETFLDANVGALVLGPADVEGVSGALRKYRSRGIPVVVVGDELADPDLCRSTIIPDNHGFGRRMGEFFVEATGGRAELVEVCGFSTTAATRLRSEGFREAIADTPGVRVVEAASADWNRERARAEADRFLRDHPLLDGVFAHNDEMALGVWEAACDASREASLLVTGIDALKGRGLSWVMQGKLAATLVNPSPGRHAALNVLALLAGEPCMERTVLQTSIFRSNERIRAWQERRRRS
jgi:ABC-type sugar transport system substrate-binding protein